MKYMRLQTVLIAVALAFVALLSPTLSNGQDTAGMSGVVSDASGAAIPSATVTLSNASTGVKYSQNTSAIGFFRFANIPPGQGYQVNVSAKGFSEFVLKDVSMGVATVRTQNIQLSVGAQEATVEVTASNANITIDTTDATVGNDIDVEHLNNLPVQQRNDPTALFTLQPGVTVSGSVAGARTDQNYVTLDGLDVTEFANANQVQNGSGVSQGFEGLIVGHAPVDSVEQFHVGVAGNTADTGAASGGQFQLVTKSGTNHFHGNVNEYHRDPSLVANSWFNNNSTPITPRNQLIQNQFGGNIGGPIWRDKAFFFFDYNNSRIIKSEDETRFVPTNTLRAGTITYCTNPSCSATDFQTQAQVKTFDPASVGEDLPFMTAFNGIYPKSNSNAVGDGFNTTGYIFNAPDSDFATNYVGRVDYNLSDRMKAFARFTISREDAVQTPEQFPGTGGQPFEDRSYAFVIGHSWVIGTKMTNRIILGETVEKFGFPDPGNPMLPNYYLFDNGIVPAIASSFYLQPAAQARRIPIPEIGDDFSLVKGNHTWQLGGTFKDILAHNTDVADYNTALIGLGGNVQNLCGGGGSGCPGGNPSLRPTDIDASQTAGWDEPFTFLLGRVGNVQSDYNYDKNGQPLKQLTGDQRFYRYYQTQVYLQDSWKLFPSFTLNYGLTYQLFSVPYETRGLESVQPVPFSQYVGARETQSSQGVSGPGAVPLLSYYLGGKANGSTAPPLYQPEYHDIAPHVGFVWNVGSDKKTVINGSAGIIYDRTVIFAVQSIQDNDSYLFQQTTTTSLGTATDPYGSIKTGPRLDAKNGLSNVTLLPPATPKSPYQPFDNASTCATQGYVAPCGLANGSAFNAEIDPALKTPYNMVFNFGLQRELPWNMVVKANFVSRLSRRLLGQADANQVLDFTDPVSGQTLSQAFGAMTTQVRAGATSATVSPQPWFENIIGMGATSTWVASEGGEVFNGDIGDFVQALANASAVPENVGSAAQFAENTFYGNFGFSNYNGLLLTLSKNLSHGVQFDFNYTWAHSIDNTSFFANSQGDTGIGSGIGLICDVVRPRECRSRSDFDIRHAISGDANYELPFGKGRMFGATAPGWTNWIIGNWDVSGVVSFNTGSPWSTVSEAFVASFSNDAPGVFIGSNKSVIKNQVTKLPGGGVRDFANYSKAALSFAGPIGFKIGPRNEMTGPDFFNADMGLQKTFPIYKEAVNLRFRTDAFNVLNHPNFSLPQNNGYNGYYQNDFRQSQFGQISSTVTPPGNDNNGARVLQLSLRLEF